MPNGDTQQFTQQEFAAKIKAKYPAYTSVPDDQLVEKITAKYPQYKSQIKVVEAPPTNAATQANESIKGIVKQPTDILSNIRNPDPKAMKAYMDMGEEKEIAEGAPPAAKTMLEMGLGGEAGGLVKGGGALKAILRMIATGTGAGVGNAAGQGITTGKVDPKESLRTAGEYAVGEGIGAAGSKVVGKVMSKVDPLAKINKLLGVEARNLIPGKTPASLDEFVANPARGALKAGLDEKALAKMNPMERNAAVMAAKDKVGAELDKVLTQASQAGGKTVNIQTTIDKTFKEILDPKLQKQAEKRLVQVLQKHGITKPLSQLTPMEARTVQRSLDDFANFAGQGEAKSFRDIARQIRKGISAETRKAVPESAQFDQDYTDLVNASKATQSQLKKFASEVPENKLRKWIIRAAATGAGLGGAYEAGKHFTTPVP